MDAPSLTRRAAASFSGEVRDRPRAFPSRLARSIRALVRSISTTASRETKTAIIPITWKSGA
jgi:hypothetical protein